MADRVVLHIGPRKTATTYLQRALLSLAQSGEIPSTMYPVRTRGRVDHNQVPGLIDLARSLGEIALQEDAWQHQDGSDAAALLRAVQTSPGTVILSAEALSVLQESGARSVVAALAPAEVDVVVTLRDLARVLPSSWQQHVRNGNIEDYPTYLQLRQEERASGHYLTDLGRGFWRAYRYGDLVRRWQASARSVAVVTVPRSSGDPAEVWRRFRAAADLADVLPALPPDVPEARANIALSGAETYALHGLNVAARESGLGRREVRQVHRRLLRHGWIARAQRGDRLGLPDDVTADATGWAEEDAVALTATGAPIFGTVDDLRVRPEDSGSLPDAEAVAAAAGVALTILRERHGRSRGDDEDDFD